MEINNFIELHQYKETMNFLTIAANTRFQPHKQADIS